MPALAIALSPQQAIEAAKAPEIAFNEKNWIAIRAHLTPDVTYDEVATQRRLKGADQVVTGWQSWAKAFPDARCSFQNAVAIDTTVVMELTWQGTHNGPLETPDKTYPATGRRIEIRACVVSELSGEKTKVQRHYFDMASLLRQLGLVT